MKGEIVYRAPTYIVVRYIEGILVRFKKINLFYADVKIGDMWWV
jgi:hypothetical protein